MGPADVFGLVILSGTVIWVLSLWSLLTAPVQRHQEPLQADPVRISELEEWNRTWCHPELGNFYAWDGSSYVETSWKKTDSGLEYYTDRDTWITTVRSTGMTLGSWCRSCKSPAHGAEYCRRCVDNYGYREGKKRYKLPNGRYVDTYEETLCEVCEEPLPLYWSRICSAECGGKLEEPRCKDTMCGGYGTVYRGGRCKGCYEVRSREYRKAQLAMWSVGRCAWCGKTGAQLWNDGKRWFCNALCQVNYQTEP